ncbi:hypothetical protein ACT2CR_00545 [Candidatus Vidania fulgoroideorum]
MNFTIIGNPIKHSKSKIIYNYLTKKYNINIKYLKINLFLIKIKTIIFILLKFNIINITIPFKTLVNKFCNFNSKNSYFINSINTIITKRYKLIGFNTDIKGFYKNIFLPKKIFLIGLGGVGISIIYSLFILGFRKINIFNKTFSRLYKIPLFIKNKLIFNFFLFKKCSIINATSSSLFGKTPVCFKIKKPLLYYDVCYVKNKLLKNISKYINGINMLYNQALSVFLIFKKNYENLFNK